MGKPAPDPSCFPKLDGGCCDSGPTDGAGSDADAGSTPFCPGGEIYCGPGGIDPNQCPSGTYCITGCCVKGDILP